jgi:hypothetical protein
LPPTQQAADELGDEAEHALEEVAAYGARALEEVADDGERAPSGMEHSVDGAAGACHRSPE